MTKRISLNKVMDMLNNPIFITQIGIKYDYEKSSIKLQLSKNATKILFKKEGKLIGYGSHFARNSFKIFSIINIPPFVIKRFFNEGKMFGEKLSAKRKTIIGSYCYDSDITGIFFNATKGMKKYTIDIGREFFVNVWSNLELSEIKNKLNV